MKKLLVLSLTALSCGAFAVPLAPGVWTNLPGTQTPGGLVLQDLSQNFSYTDGAALITGSVTSRVVQKADGTLFFAWRVSNDPNSQGGVGTLRLGNFIADQYDGDYDPTSPWPTPITQAFLFPAPHAPGYINVLFGSTSGVLDAGSDSKFFYLDTHSHSYGMTAFYDLANLSTTQISGEYSTFAPTVPEPASVAALGMGFAALLRRRRK